MPYRDPDPSDPNMLVGVELAGDKENMRDLSYAVAEELARSGKDAEQIRKIFTNRFYANAFAAYHALGEDEIETIIEECVEAFRGLREMANG